MDNYNISLKDKTLYEEKDTKEVTLPLLPQEYALINTLQDLKKSIDELARAMRGK